MPPTKGNKIAKPRIKPRKLPIVMRITREKIQKTPSTVIRTENATP